MLYLSIVGHKCLCACAYWFLDILSKVFAINLIIEVSKTNKLHSKNKGLLYCCMRAKQNRGHFSQYKSNKKIVNLTNFL